MNKFLLVVFVVLLAGSGFAQKPQRPAAKPSSPIKKPVAKPKPALTPAPADPAAEKAKLDEALALATAAERVSALKKFIGDFPASEHRPRATESMVTARAILGDEKLQANESSDGIALFKLAVEEAPSPIPERLFNEIVSKFPANLFYRDQRAAGIEIAEAIEKKAAGNAKQLLNLAAFYLGIEGGAEAKRLAEAAIQIEPNSVAAYQTLGLAHRVNFDLDESAAAYAKALEIDPASVAAKRSLAEMRRALGKHDEAAALYREIVTANDSDSAARTGLILSLFGSGKTSDAESEMAKSLEQNPKNLSLLAGAAYWYAANDSGDKAVELARKAVELEPRYIWGHIALARGLMRQKKPVEAERILVMARQHGNFPTLEYEIASARLMAGFYREAVEELQKSFSINDGLIKTKLGGRVPREEKSFTDLIAYERRASIFEPAAADDLQNAAKLQLLFEISQKLNADAPDETELSANADEFVKGDDKMKLHRQIYLATILLQKNVALPKVLELVKAAVGNADAGLDVSTPAAAVMASELYESRTVAFARNEIIVVPDVPRQTLSAILRGRIEELTGWTLYQQKSYPEAVVRLRRAISVLPDKSAWWRSSMWRLGSALEADGKDKEALDSYIQSYKTDRPSALKYSVVEALYKKVHGSADGLETKIGPNPLSTIAAEPAKSSETNISPPPAAAKTIAREVQTKAPFVQAPKKIAESVQPTVDDTAQHAQAKTRVADEPPVKTVETSEPKTENVTTPDKLIEAAAQIPETALKKAETDEAKTVSTPEKQADTKVPVAEPTSKTVETNDPKIDDAVVPKKQDEPKTPVVEPARAVEESLPKADDIKTEVKTPEVKADLPEAQKSEPSTQVPPVVEQVRKTETAVTAQPTPTETPQPENDKIFQKVESIPQPQPNPELPAKTEPQPDEPKNLLRDPLSEPEPEPKAQPPAEKPADPQPSSKPAKEADKKLTVIIDDPIGDRKKAASTKDLFEPVIIQIPGGSPAKPVKKEPVEKPVDDAVSSGASRMRVVDGKEIKSDSQCSLDFSHETVSLINGGGSLGILVSMAGTGDLKDVVATSSSPKDIEVRAEAEIEGISGRRFYVVRSVSTAVGVYQVTFESPCGKKEIVVKVR